MPERRKRKAAAVKPALSFNHAMLYSRDLAASRRFYVDLLGFEVIEEQLPYYARLRAARGTGTLAIHALEPGKTLPAAGGSVFISRRRISTESRSSWKRPESFSSSRPR
jgi:catechol 2,3-dioxygenase-like lactoylglutathione lyase family enzyme